MLDPFNGTATTGKVALEEGRDFVGIKINLWNVTDSRKRLIVIQPKASICMDIKTFIYGDTMGLLLNNTKIFIKFGFYTGILLLRLMINKYIYAII